ncbi:MAG: hypothetical protein Q9178_005148 [Gyalolechia marmorata]
MHCVYVFAAAATTRWLGFRHNLHNDWDQWNCLNDYKLNNLSSVTYWIRFGHYIYHNWDKWYCLDHHELNDYATTAARISLQYHIHNNQAGWYCLNGNKSNNDSTFSITQHVYNHWNKWHRLNCDDFNDGFCSSTATSTSLNFRHNAGDNESSGIDNHNNPKHSDHASSLFQSSTASADERGCAAVPDYSASCGGRYNDNLGQVWCVQCQTAYFFDDLVTVSVGSFEECLQSCDTYVPSPNVARGASCIAITWGPRAVGGECYRKFNVTDARPDRRQDSAYKCDQDIIPPSASSAVNTNTANIASTGGSVSTARPTTPATSNPNVPATTAPAASNPGIPATLISSSTTATSVNPVLAFQPCPSSNNQQFIDPLGFVYDIKCACDLQFGDLGALRFDYFQDCILACDRYVPDPNKSGGAACIGVSWGRGDRNTGPNCYLKFTIPQIRCGEPDFCAAVRHTYSYLPLLVSTSRVTSTASIAPATSLSSASSSAPPVVVSSSSASQPPVVVPSSSTSRPPIVSSSSASQPPVVASSSTTSRPPVVVPSSSSTPVLAPSSTTNSQTPANTFAPPRISNQVSCPAQNGSIYTDFFGQTWEVRCGQNIRGSNVPAAVHADSWEKCLQFCDILGGATGVTYPGGGGDNTNPFSVNCYPYDIFTEFVSGASPTLVAARPLNGSTGNGFNTEQLCPGYDNITFTDVFERTYQIRCDQGFVGGAGLAGTITKTLEGCLSYCSPEVQHFSIGASVW